MKKNRLLFLFLYFDSFRAAILEQENMKLRLEVSQLKQETAKLRCMVYAPS